MQSVEMSFDHWPSIPGALPVQYHDLMRCLLLTARPDLWTNRRFAEAAERLQIDLQMTDATAVCAITGTRSALLSGGDDLLRPPPDAVIARVGNWRPESLLAILEVAVDAGVATPNPPAAIRGGRDHWLTVRTLSSAGLGVPATVAGAEPEALAAAAVRRLGLPVVVKQRRSRMGVGVILCERRDHLESVLDSLWRVGDEIVVQQFVNTGGTSLRALVVGDQVVAAARFTATAGEWRSNAARGGRSERVSLGEHESSLVREAAAAMKLKVCGVDLLPCGDRPVIAEVNPTPGFRRLEEVTGIDVAGAILDFTTSLARPIRSPADRR